MERLQIFDTPGSVSRRNLTSHVNTRKKRRIEREAGLNKKNILKSCTCVCVLCYECSVCDVAVVEYAHFQSEFSTFYMKF